MILLDTGTSGNQQGNLFSEFDDGETLVRNPSFINRVL